MEKGADYSTAKKSRAVMCHVTSGPAVGLNATGSNRNRKMSKSTRKAVTIAASANRASRSELRSSRGA